MNIYYIIALTWAFSCAVYLSLVVTSQSIINYYFPQAIASGVLSLMYFTLAGKESHNRAKTPVATNYIKRFIFCPHLKRIQLRHFLDEADIPEYDPYVKVPARFVVIVAETFRISQEIDGIAINDATFQVIAEETEYLGENK